MDEKNREAFIRWQGRTIDQMSSVSNLLIALATGLLAFEAQQTLGPRPPTPGYERTLGLLSIASVALSLIVGLSLAWNRLSDFRLTARIVRERAQPVAERDILRDEAKALGEASWRLLIWQGSLFLVGTAILAVLAMVRA